MTNSTTSLTASDPLLSLIEQERDRRRSRRRYDWRGVECPFHSPDEPYIEGRCLHARPAQVMPGGPWRLWLVKAGRGWGKTRVGAETVREWSERYSRIGLIAPTGDDARDIMVEGESGLLAVFPPERPARYIANRRRVEFPSGSIGTIYTADEPERLRGPQHTKLWCDEIAAWRYLDAAFDMAMLGLRLGRDPQAVLTTTPKPVRLIKQLRDRSRVPLGSDPLGQVVMTEGSTYENRANLAPQFVGELIQKYEGTRLGRQELHAEVLEDVEGALWSGGIIEPHRRPALPSILRTVVAVDPATTHGPDSDETAITVASTGEDGEYYVRESIGLRASPEVWGSRVLSVYDETRADVIVAEVNQGGEMVAAVLRAVCARTGREMPRLKTIHAKKGKVLRAEPIVAMYEQGRVHHVGVHDVLEDQQTSFPVASEHDDRVDATVYALTELATKPAAITAY